MRWLGNYLPSVVMGGGVLLMLQLHRQIDAPLPRELAALPDTMYGYTGRDLVIPPEELQVSGVTNYLLRVFQGPDERLGMSLYVGYYPSQAQGQTIHSPKNCLPGAGWEPVSAGTADIAAGGQTWRVNRYVIAKDNVSALVYYWYQGRGRVAWDEFRVKLDLMRDKALSGRSEEALVRIVIPMRGTEAEADSLAQSVAARVIPQLFETLPAL